MMRASTISTNAVGFKPKVSDRTTSNSNANTAVGNTGKQSSGMPRGKKSAGSSSRSPCRIEGSEGRKGRSSSCANQIKGSSKQKTSDESKWVQDISEFNVDEQSQRRSVNAANSSVSKKARFLCIDLYKLVKQQLGQNIIDEFDVLNDFDLLDDPVPLEKMITNIHQLIEIHFIQARASIAETQAQHDQECASYDKNLQQLEAQIRDHIRLQHELKLCLESTTIKNSELLQKLNKVNSEHTQSIQVLNLEIEQKNSQIKELSESLKQQQQLNQKTTQIANNQINQQKGRSITISNEQIGQLDPRKAKVKSQHVPVMASGSWSKMRAQTEGPVDQLLQEDNFMMMQNSSSNLRCNTDKENYMGSANQVISTSNSRSQQQNAHTQLQQMTQNYNLNLVQQKQKLVDSKSGKGLVVNSQVRQSSSRNRISPEKKRILSLILQQQKQEATGISVPQMVNKSSRNEQDVSSNTFDELNCSVSSSQCSNRSCLQHKKPLKIGGGFEKKQQVVQQINQLQEEQQQQQQQQQPQQSRLIQYFYDKLAEEKQKTNDFVNKSYQGDFSQQQQQQQQHVQIPNSQNILEKNRQVRSKSFNFQTEGNQERSKSGLQLQEKPVQQFQQQQQEQQFQQQLQQIYQSNISVKTGDNSRIMSKKPPIRNSAMNSINMVSCDNQSMSISNWNNNNRRESGLNQQQVLSESIFKEVKNYDEEEKSMIDNTNNNNYNALSDTFEVDENQQSLLQTTFPDRFFKQSFILNNNSSDNLKALDL